MEVLKLINDSIDEIVQESLSTKIRKKSPTLKEITSCYTDEKGNDLEQLRFIMQDECLELEGEDLVELLGTLLDVLRVILPKTIQNWLIKIRNWGRDNLKDDKLKLFMDNTRLTAAEWEIRDKMQTASRENANEKQRKIKMSDIQVLLTSVLGSEDWRDRYILAMLCTGRRMVEIVTSGFALIEDNSHHILFTDRAKVKKGKDSPDMIIPTLFCTPEDVLENIIDLRSIVDPRIEGFDKLAIHTLLSKTIDARLKGYLKGWQAHMCRKVYALLTYKNYRNDCSFNSYIKTVLGHEGLDTSLNYTNVRIIFDAADTSRVGGNENDE